MSRKQRGRKRKLDETLDLTQETDDSSAEGVGEPPAKRKRVAKPKKGKKMKELDVECPICYERYDGEIYQCRNGHMVCEDCYPQLQRCPQCSITMTDGIRNRAWEQFIGTSSKKKCIFREFGCRQELRPRKHDEHVRTCQYRLMACRFDSCCWFGAMADFKQHCDDFHSTSQNTTALVPGPLVSDSKNYSGLPHGYKPSRSVYEFTHAIKFPTSTVLRIEECNRTGKEFYTKDMSNMDLMWPKVYRFSDDEKFFVLTRFIKGQLFIVVRHMSLPTLDSHIIGDLVSATKLSRASIVAQYTTMKAKTEEILEERRKRGVVGGTSGGITLNELSYNKLAELVKHMKYKPAHETSRGEYEVQMLYKPPRPEMPANGGLIAKFKSSSELYGLNVDFNYELDRKHVITVLPNLFSRCWSCKETTDAKSVYEKTAVVRFHFVIQLDKKAPEKK